MKQALIILGRYPKPGSVKTRLAKEIGEENATKFYKQCAEYDFEQIDKLPNKIKKFFLYPTNAELEKISEWTKNKYEFIKPQSSDINHNILVSFVTIFNLGYEKVVTVATDLPDLTTEIIYQAFKKLDDYDIVIGPDNDGGIYLYGQKQNHPEIFNLDPEQKILASVLENIKKAKLKYSLRKRLIDVDTKKDLKIWMKQLNPNHPLKHLSDLNLHTSDVC